MNVQDLSPDQWQHLKTVMSAALNCSSSERVELLQRHLPHDPALKIYAIDLLQHYDRASRRFGVSSTSSMDDGDGPTASSAGKALSIGQTVGHYRLVDLLGRGGMGVVYRAQDLRLERYVALKFLAPGSSTKRGDENDRVLAESRATATMNHPAIVTLHDIFEFDGELVAVMEYVEGRSLRRMLGEPLSLGFALRLVGQLADALSYAHGRGIIHCDLKPENIHVSPSNTPKILDFGLARLIARSGEAAMAETPLVGTMGYLAPERLLGREATASADVYALGVILFECLTGRAPFPAHDAGQLFVDTLAATPAPPSSLVSAIPRPIDELTMRCLAKSPRDRLQPHEIVGAIGRLLTELETAPVVLLRNPTPDTGAIETPAAARAARPQQRFVLTSDGVRIAYAVHGEGPPLIFVRGWMSHLDLMWDDRRFREFMLALGRDFTVIRYDARGNGLSQRTSTRLELGDLVKDLEALVEQLELPGYFVYGSTFGGLIAAVYAARYPQQVKKLILDGSYADGSAVTTLARKLFLLNAFKVFPEAAYLVLGYATNPGPSGGPAKGPELLQQMIEPAAAAKLYKLALTVNISEEAKRIECPTLIIHRRESHSVPVSLARKLAALVPRSTLAILAGPEHNLWEGDAAEALDEIRAFLSDASSPDADNVSRT